MLDEILKSFEEKNARIKALKEEIKKETQDNIKEIFVFLFNENEWLEEITWSQYTPYFNDGDSCEFNVYETTVNGCSIYKNSLYNENYGSHLGEDFTKKFIEKASPEIINKLENVLNIVEKFKNNIGDDVLLDIFGDHAQVVITRNGVQIEEVDHD